MSFGYSVSDAVVLVQLAWNTVQNARVACGAHDELTREAIRLHGVLQRLEQEVGKAESPLNRRDDTSGQELQRIARDCGCVLKQLDKIVSKYAALSEEKRSGRKIWQRVRFGNGEMASLGDLRAKVTLYASEMSFYLNMVSMGAVGRIERMMAKHGGVLREMQLSINRTAAQKLSGGSREGSVLSVYADDDTGVWKELRRELIGEGYASDFIRKHKHLIKRYVKELSAHGLFDEDVSLSLEEQQKGSQMPTEAINNGEYYNKDASTQADRIDKNRLHSTDNDAKHEPRHRVKEPNSTTNAIDFNSAETSEKNSSATGDDEFGTHNIGNRYHSHFGNITRDVAEEQPLDTPVAAQTEIAQESICHEGIEVEIVEPFDTQSFRSKLKYRLPEEVEDQLRHAIAGLGVTTPTVSEDRISTPTTPCVEHVEHPPQNTSFETSLADLDSALYEVIPYEESEADFEAMSQPDSIDGGLYEPDSYVDELTGLKAESLELPDNPDALINPGSNLEAIESIEIPREVCTQSNAKAAPRHAYCETEEEAIKNGTLEALDEPNCEQSQGGLVDLDPRLPGESLPSTSTEHHPLVKGPDGIGTALRTELNAELVDEAIADCEGQNVTIRVLGAGEMVEETETIRHESEALQTNTKSDLCAECDTSAQSYTEPHPIFEAPTQATIMGSSTDRSHTRRPTGYVHKAESIIQDPPIRPTKMRDRSKRDSGYSSYGSPTGDINRNDGAQVSSKETLSSSRSSAATVGASASESPESLESSVFDGGPWMPQEVWRTNLAFAITASGICRSCHGLDMSFLFERFEQRIAVILDCLSRPRTQCVQNCCFETPGEGVQFNKDLDTIEDFAKAAETIIDRMKTMAYRDDWHTNPLRLFSSLATFRAQPYNDVIEEGIQAGHPPDVLVILARWIKKFDLGCHEIVPCLRTWWIESAEIGRRQQTGATYPPWFAIPGQEAWPTVAQGHRYPTPSTMPRPRQQPHFMPQQRYPPQFAPDQQYQQPWMPPQNHSQYDIPDYSHPPQAAPQQSQWAYADHAQKGPPGPEYRQRSPLDPRTDQRDQAPQASEPDSRQGQGTHMNRQYGIEEALRTFAKLFPDGVSRQTESEDIHNLGTGTPNIRPMPESQIATTSLDEINNILRTFHFEYVPQCNKFVTDPPSTSEQRIRLYRSLTETILAQVLVKLDAVDTGGDIALKTLRKNAITYANVMLRAMDETEKGFARTKREAENCTATHAQTVPTTIPLWAPTANQSVNDHAMPTGKKIRKATESQSNVSQPLDEPGVEPTPETTALALLRTAAKNLDRSWHEYHESIAPLCIMWVRKLNWKKRDDQYVTLTDYIRSYQGRLCTAETGGDATLADRKDELMSDTRKMLIALNWLKKGAAITWSERWTKKCVLEGSRVVIEIENTGYRAYVVSRAGPRCVWCHPSSRREVNASTDWRAAAADSTV